jgi:hypothetical protein
MDGAMNAFTQGWVLTLCFFALFCGGSIYAWKFLEQKNAAAAYDRCVESFARSAKDAADFKHKIALCQMQHNEGPILAGRYGTTGGAPVSLAMMRRPDF